MGPTVRVAVTTGDWAPLWTYGVRTGLALLRRDPILGLRRLILPVSYWRRAEFGYAWRRLGPQSGMRLLDVGSPKELGVFLARYAACEVLSLDILEAEVHAVRRYAAGLGPDEQRRLRAEVQDARALPYPDSSFDAAFSISVLEHIPEDGDTRAIRELVRVVRPGGRVVVTTPFDRVYRETWVERPVFERAHERGRPVFYQRHYDEQALRDRLILPAEARLADRELWGERRLRGEGFLRRMGPLRTALSPLEPALSALALHRMEGRQHEHPMAVFFTLIKP